MKKTITLLVLIFTIATVRADFVIQQKVEGRLNGIITLKIKGDKTRTDIPGDRQGEVSVIEDLNLGQRIMLVHKQKLARIETAAQLEQQIKSYDADPVASILVDTGKTENVGDYVAEIYTWTNNVNTGWTIWVARDYPGYEKIRNQLKKINQSPGSQLHRHISPDTSALPGMIVKFKIESQKGESINTLISVKEEPVNDSDFQIPADYRADGQK